MNNEEYSKLISALNEYIYSKEYIGINEFSFASNGFCTVILFGQAVLYNDSEDDRDFNEDVNDYEPLQPFIIKKFIDYVNELIKIKNMFLTTY